VAEADQGRRQRQVRDVFRGRSGAGKVAEADADAEPKKEAYHGPGTVLESRLQTKRG
jgi:hypothetical protein